MRLDLWTLIFVTVFVTIMLGCLLLFAWSQNRRIEALSWWGAGFLVASVGSCLLVGRTIIPDSLSVVVANALLSASYGLMWAGCRSFAGRRTSWTAALTGSAIWLICWAIPGLFAAFPARVIVSSGIGFCYTLAGALEMRRTRAERLASRRPILVVMMLHATAMASRPVILWMFELHHDTTLFTFPWITAHAFETLMATVLLSFLFLAIAKERVEREQRIMASCDPLTGILNRRAFVDEGERRLAESRTGPPSVLLLFDIDHFKRINDAFGHATGDAVLTSFCQLVTDRLPAGALFARLGGEEFGCLLSGTSAVEGYYEAEYVRNALSLRPLVIDGQCFRVTVSIGLATTAESGHDLQGLMSAADSALYRAKRAGRNRVLFGAIPLALAA
jgi:diguanylate cyclase (GGDEF)-like protein